MLAVKSFGDQTKPDHVDQKKTDRGDQIKQNCVLYGYLSRLDYAFIPPIYATLAGKKKPGFGISFLETCESDPWDR